MESIEKQMDKAIKAGDFAKFIAFFGQFSGTKSKNVTFYKNIALLYYLSLEKFDKYYALLQTCMKNPVDFSYVINVYEAIRICDATGLEGLRDKADSSYKRLLEQIYKNTQMIYEGVINDERHAQGIVEKKLEADIADCVYVISNFKK